MYYPLGDEVLLYEEKKWNPTKFIRFKPNIRTSRVVCILFIIFYMHACIYTLYSVSAKY